MDVSISVNINFNNYVKQYVYLAWIALVAIWLHIHVGREANCQ